MRAHTKWRPFFQLRLSLYTSAKASSYSGKANETKLFHLLGLLFFVGFYIIGFLQMIFSGNVALLMFPSVLIDIILVKLQNTYFVNVLLQLIYGTGLRASLNSICAQLVFLPCYNLKGVIL